MLWGLAVALLPLCVRAQESGADSNFAEGYALHHATKTLYFYRISDDSTVYVREGKSPETDASITLPAQTFSAINKRVEKHVLAPDSTAEHLGLSYKDQYLVLQFNQRFDLYVLGTLIVVLLGGSILLFWLWRRLSKERRRREALARSRRYLAEGREKERERLAQEIHDGPVQDLHGLHMRLKSLDDRPPARELKETGDELMRVTGELRAMSANLHPPALQRFGLSAALRSHADRLRERYSDVTIEIDVDDDCPSFPDTYSLAIFRIAQEATNNAVQHGQAKQIRVALACEDAVELEIQDDGDGFAPPENLNELAAEDHYGLLGMQERADAIGADLDIQSAPGAGTRVRLQGEFEPTDSPTAEHDHTPAPA